MSFIRIVIAISAIEGMASPLMTTLHATGRIALYQSLVGTLTILNIPISYVFLKFNYPPITVFVVSFVIAVICLFIRLWIANRLIGFPIKRYIINVLLICSFVSAISSIVPTCIYIFTSVNFISFLFVVIASFISTSICVLFLGISKPERVKICSYIGSMLKSVFI